MGSAWKQQLDRKGVKPVLYDKLVDMAVDHRTRQISLGQAPTPLTVELMLSCFESYRTQAYARRRQLQQTYNNILSVVERVRAGLVPEEVGTVSLLSVGTETDEEVSGFDELAARVTERYEQKLDGFLEEYHLE